MSGAASSVIDLFNVYECLEDGRQDKCVAAGVATSPEVFFSATVRRLASAATSYLGGRRFSSLEVTFEDGLLRITFHLSDAAAPVAQRLNNVSDAYGVPIYKTLSRRLAGGKWSLARSSIGKILVHPFDERQFTAETLPLLDVLCAQLNNYMKEYSLTGGRIELAWRDTEVTAGGKEARSTLRVDLLA